MSCRLIVWSGVVVAVSGRENLARRAENLLKPAISARFAHMKANATTRDTEMRGLAYRRHKAYCKRAKRIHYYGNWPMDHAKIAGKVAKTPKLCSCYMCSNRRKYDGLSRGEKQNLLNYMDELNE